MCLIFMTCTKNVCKKSMFKCLMINVFFGKGMLKIHIVFYFSNNAY